MALYHSLTDFLAPLALDQIADDEGYRDGQIGKHIAVHQDEFPDLDAADVVIVGCGEGRGAGNKQISNQSPDAVRRAFYQLYYWHTDTRLADVGNLKPGAALGDSYAALETVISELTENGKTVMVIGGSHDLTLAQYRSAAARAQIVEATIVDAKIDLDTESMHAADQFLMELLTSEPNFLSHYNHIGFQSYLLHPSMLETLDKLRFDCYRVGKVKENIEEMEPVIRNSEIFSFDVSSIANAFAPANRLTANGFDGPALLARTQEDAIKAKLAANTEAAVARGAFGIPTFFVGDEIFFGKDRLGQVEEALLG